MRKRWLILIIVIIVVAIIGYKMKGGGKPAGFQMPPTVVDVAVAAQQSWQQQIKAVGTLNANQGVMVNPEVGGVVTQIFFKSGQEIQQDSPLVQLNPSVIQAQLAAAQAQLVLSEKQYQRYATLYAQRVSAKADLDTAEATMNSNQAAVEKAQAELDQTLIRAPFSGKLGLKLIDLGQYLSPGQAIVNLQDIDHMRVDFQVPEIYLSQLQVGQTVWISAAAYGNQVFKGTVYAFDSAVNANNRSLGLRARIPNPQHILVPGTFVDVSLFVGQPKPIVVIPQIAVMYSVGNVYVYKVVDGKAVQTPIVLGQNIGDNVEVTSGLNQGDVVIIGGQIKVADGSSVIVRNLAAAETAVKAAAAVSDATNTKNADNPNSNDNQKSSIAAADNTDKAAPVQSSLNIGNNNPAKSQVTDSNNSSLPQVSNTVSTPSTAKK